jgi:hypothetical protein
MVAMDSVVQKEFQAAPVHTRPNSPVVTPKAPM